MHALVNLMVNKMVVIITFNTAKNESRLRMTIKFKIKMRVNSS
jgi:hypothetical protein